MKCRVCGGLLTKQITDLPFKTDVNSIVIILLLDYALTRLLMIIDPS